MIRQCACFAALAGLYIGLGADSALAAHAGDIFLADENDKIVTGRVEEDETVTLPVYVFPSVFGDTGTPGFTANPGFDTNPGMFEPGYRIGFNIRDQFLCWVDDGFAPTGGDHLEETLTISFGGWNVTTGEGFVEGFDLAVQADGGFHRHFNFVLNPGGEQDAPDPGIYLLELEMYGTDPNLETSDPFWIVFRHEDTEEHHDEAIEWVDENLAPSCDGDINGDGAVDTADLLLLLGDWGQPGGPADIDGSGLVDTVDLLLLLGQWGECP